MSRSLTPLDFVLVVGLDVRGWHHKDNVVLEHAVPYFIKLFPKDSLWRSKGMRLNECACTRTF